MLLYIIIDVFLHILNSNEVNITKMKVHIMACKRKYNKLFCMKFTVYTIMVLIIFLTASGCSEPVPRLTAPPQQTPQADNIIAAGDTDISTAAGKVIPSVVGITITKTQEGRRVQGVGSGIIIDSAGYILTNNHVAGGTIESMSVSLYDGRDAAGTTIWTDPTLDLAIVKIDISGLPTAALGDSKNIKIGQPAVAIGNPLGLTFQRTVTAGVISAINRTIEVGPQTYMEGLLQTDASINPGNSGGPLINVRGEVIGINTIKVTTAEGIGFAVPINVAKPVIEKVRTGGNFVTPTLGMTAVDGNIGRLYSFADGKGVYVMSCKDGGCAHKAGLVKGDAILSVNDIPVNSAIELKEELYKIGDGNHVKLRVKDSNGRERDVIIKLGGK